MVQDEGREVSREQVMQGPCVRSGSMLGFQSVLNRRAAWSIHDFRKITVATLGEQRYFVKSGSGEDRRKNIKMVQTRDDTC